VNSSTASVTTFSLGARFASSYSQTWIVPVFWSPVFVVGAVEGAHAAKTRPAAASAVHRTILTLPPAGSPHAA
jgi:hypothetical protein